MKQEKRFSELVLTECTNLHKPTCISNTFIQNDCHIAREVTWDQLFPCKFVIQR